MTSIRFIGDVHGKWKQYKKIISECDTSIQVGDFGVGFVSKITEAIHSNPPYDHMKKGDHRFIRGNHDNPNECKKHPFWIPDGTMIHDKIFCIGGAKSIDAHHRTQGYNWWMNEELSYKEFLILCDAYEQLKPEVIVAHEMPESLTYIVCSKCNMTKYDDPSVTRQFLDNILEIHKPKLFIHGHWHVNHHTIYNDVEYIGLGELEYVDLEL
jgi:calcineurin-like phosphoesterase family protein